MFLGLLPSGPAVRRALHLVLWTAVVLVTWHRYSWYLDDFRMVSPTRQEVDLPYTFFTGKNTYVFEGTLHQSFLTPSSLVVRVDDCVEWVALDDKEFFRAPCNQCDHCPGTRIDLPKDIPNGPHKIVFQIQDHAPPAIFSIREATGLHGLLVFLWWLGGVALMLFIARRNLSMYYAWLPLMSMALCFAYGTMTDPFTRQHDVDGHREYIQYLLSSHQFPSIKHGWETWQPPFYYVLNALWVAGTRLIVDTHDIFLRVQAFSALLYSLAVLLAALLWRRFNFSSSSAWVGVTLFALMPAHVFVSARVNNDSIMPLFGMLVTVLAWEYAQRGTWRVLAATSGLLVICLMTKMSSLSLVAGAGLSLMVSDHLARRGWGDRLVRMAAMGLPSALWVAFWLRRNHEQTGEWLYVNAALQDGLKVANTAYKYFSFDLRAFLSEGFFYTFDGRIRQSFPTALATSLLTGEFQMEFLSLELRTFVRAAFLPMLALFAVGVLARPRDGENKPWRVALLVFGAHALFMASYNWRYSYACNEDARLWASAYFPAALVFAWGHEVACARFSGPARGLLRVAPIIFIVMLLALYRAMLMP